MLKNKVENYSMHIIFGITQTGRDTFLLSLKSFQDFSKCPSKNCKFKANIKQYDIFIIGQPLYFENSFSFFTFYMYINCCHKTNMFHVACFILQQEIKHSHVSYGLIRSEQNLKYNGINEESCKKISCLHSIFKLEMVSFCFPSAMFGHNQLWHFSLSLTT